MSRPLTQPECLTLLSSYLKKEQERVQANAFAAGGPILPRRPVPVVASSTATVRPANPFVIQSDRLAAIQAQVAQNTPVLKPTGYVPEVVKDKFRRQQAYREVENKILNVADGASMTLPIPVVGETVGLLGAGIGAGIRASRAADDARHGNYLSAANNAINAIGAVVLPAVVKTGADLLKQQRLISSVARRPTFVPGLAVQQAEADAGADWARNWFKGRAESSMGGLTPANAPLASSIKRPVVPDGPTWDAMTTGQGPGKTTYGVYYPSQNVATVSPTTPYPQSFAAHEATHQFQNAARNTPAMKQGLSTIKQELPGVETNTSFDRYWNKPIEVHARLNQLRHELGYKPSEFITRERFMADLKNHAATGSEPGKYAVDYFDVNRIGIDNTVNWLNKLPSVVLPVTAGVFGAGALAGIKKRPGE